MIHLVLDWIGLDVHASGWILLINYPKIYWKDFVDASKKSISLDCSKKRSTKTEKDKKRKTKLYGAVNGMKQVTSAVKSNRSELNCIKF